MTMLDRIIRLAGESGELPLAVTYHIEDFVTVPARVTRLLKNYFEAELPSHTNGVGTTNPARKVLLDYRGEPMGSKRRVPKKYQNPRGPRSLPGVHGEDLQKVRIMSGRSPN